MCHGNTLRALQFAGAGVGAVTEAQLVHLCNHCLCAALGLGTTLRQQSQGTHTGCHKQHCGAVLTGSDTCTAANACGGIHAFLCLVVRDKDIVCILGRSGTDGDESAGLKNLVECRPVYYQVLDYRESGAAPRFYRNGCAVFEVTHEKLAGGYMVVRAMGAAVYVK